MNIESARAYCNSLPHVTEKLQWGNDLVFSVGGKMFCVVCAEPDRKTPVFASFKCTEEKFAELTESSEDIIPAPYLARHKWVGLRRWNVLRDSQLRELIAESHRLVFEKLPRKIRDGLSQAATAKASKSGARKKSIAR